MPSLMHAQGVLLAPQNSAILEYRDQRAFAYEKAKLQMTFPETAD